MACRLRNASPRPLCSVNPVPVPPWTGAPISSEDFEERRKQHVRSKSQKQSPNKGRKISSLPEQISRTPIRFPVLANDKWFAITTSEWTSPNMHLIRV